MTDWVKDKNLFMATSDQGFHFSTAGTIATPFNDMLPKGYVHNRCILIFFLYSWILFKTEHWAQGK